MRVGRFDARLFGWKSLTPARRGALRLPLDRHAREERARAIGAALLLPANKVRGAVRTMWERYRERHMRLRELAELAAMDDMALKDIAISRLDIRAALRSGADLRSADE